MCNIFITLFIFFFIKSNLIYFLQWITHQVIFNSCLHFLNLKISDSGSWLAVEGRLVPESSEAGKLTLEQKRCVICNTMNAIWSVFAWQSKWLVLLQCQLFQICWITLMVNFTPFSGPVCWPSPTEDEKKYLDVITSNLFQVDDDQKVRLRSLFIWKHLDFSSSYYIWSLYIYYYYYNACKAEIFVWN